jgi:hypothetical protein
MLNKLALLAILFFSAQFVFGGNRYALVVGIDNYPTVRNLTGSVRDAESVAKFFESNKFTEVKKLTDKQATRKAILEAFAYFQNKAESGDMFYFYFSGHGTVFPDNKSEERDESKILLAEKHPTTGKLLFPAGKYDQAISPYDHKAKTSGKAWSNNILDDELYNEFAKFAAKDCFAVLISDSCHSGTLARNLEGRSYRFLAPDEAYAEAKIQPKIFKFTTEETRAVKLKGNFLALTAAGDNQLAEELCFGSVSGEMGIFTYYLLEILKQNPSINLAELTEKLDVKVKSKNKRQTVQLEKRFFKGDLNQVKFLP